MKSELQIQQPHFFRSKGGSSHALISDPTVSSRHQANCRNQRIVEKVGSPKIVCRMPVVDSPQRKRKACIQTSSPRCLILSLSLPGTWNCSGLSLCPHHIKLLFRIPKSVYDCCGKICVGHWDLFCHVDLCNH